MNEAREWNDESRYALNVYEKALGIIGIWPLNAREFKSIARCSLAILIQISTIGSLSLEVYRQCLGTEDMMEAFLFDLSSIVSLSKLLVIRFSWRHTYILVTSVINDWSVSRDTRQREVMMRYTHVGRIVSLTILYLGYASGASFLFMAVPFENFIPWLNVSKAIDNGTVVTKYFLATYCVFGSLPAITYSSILLLQVVQIFVNATSHCGNDGFFFGLAMHLCGQFEVLQMDFAGIEPEKRTGRIGRSAYDSPWYDFDVKVMKNLPMVMLRGKMPHQTTAGKFLSVLRVMIDV